MTHTGAKNDMTLWDDIACRRGHTSHTTRGVEVVLDPSYPHGYHDDAQIPERLARRFLMDVWEPDLYPVDGGLYCPAHDAVSETIVSHRIWETRETIVALTVCENAQPGQIMVDFGAQLGWFSLLAASCGLTVESWEADRANLDVLNDSAEANGWNDRVVPVHSRVGPDTFAAEWEERIRFAKIDVEGAEVDAIRVLWPSIEAGNVDVIAAEISPVFIENPHYPHLVQKIVDAGYAAYVLPEKAQPPVPMDDLGAALVRVDTLSRPDLYALVAGCGQMDMVFRREEASW